MKSFVLRQMRKKSQVYILPTKLGGYFGGLIFLLFILAISYSSNLLLIFSLILFSFLLMWLVEAHFSLKKIKIQSINLENFFQDEAGHIKIKLTKDLNPENVAVYENEFEIKVESGQFIRIQKRGKFNLNHLKVVVTYFGLFKTWIYYPINISFFVYPQRQKSLKLEWKDLEIKNDQDESFSILKSSSGESGDDLGQWQGESLNRVKWGIFARTDDFFVSTSSHHLEKRFFFDLDPSDQNKEKIISSLAFDIDEMFHAKQAFVLKLRHQFFVVEADDLTQYQRCLEELAVC